MSNEGCFTFIIHHFVCFMSLTDLYLIRELKKGCQKAWATVNVKTSIFNLKYLSHFCMDFYATNRIGRAVKGSF